LQALSIALFDGNMRRSHKWKQAHASSAPKPSSQSISNNCRMRHSIAKYRAGPSRACASITHPCCRGFGATQNLSDACDPTADASHVLPLPFIFAGQCNARSYKCLRYIIPFPKCTVADVNPGRRTLLFATSSILEGFPDGHSIYQVERRYRPPIPAGFRPRRIYVHVPRVLGAGSGRCDVARSVPSEDAEDAADFFAVTHAFNSSISSRTLQS
jgi:hypothetical protein